MAYCDRGYGRPSLRAGSLASSGHAPCDVLSSKSRVRVPAVARLQAHLHDLVTAIHEISGLKIPAKKKPPAMFISNTVRGNTVRTAQTFSHYTQIALKRNTKNSYFIIFFLSFSPNEEFPSDICKNRYLWSISSSFCCAPAPGRVLGSWKRNRIPDPGYRRCHRFLWPRHQLSL